MTKRFFFAVVILSFVCGCANPYIQYFVEKDVACKQRNKKFYDWNQCFWKTPNSIAYTYGLTDRLTEADADYIAIQEKLGRITTEEAFAIYKQKSFQNLEKLRAEQNANARAILTMPNYTPAPLPVFVPVQRLP